MGSKALPAGMKLGSGNPIIEEALGDRLVGGRREAAELSVSDFDGSRWKLACAPESLNIVTVHLDLGAWAALEQLGAREVLDTLYAGMTATPAPGYKVAVSVDCDACDDAAATVEKLILLKRHLLGAPFKAKFEALAAGAAAAGPVAVVPWRDSGEAVYVMAQNDPAAPQNYDRVCVVYSVDFPEETDRAMCRILLQQFAEQHRAIAHAPPVVFSEASKPPLEIRNLVGDREAGFVGYVSFTVFARHVDGAARLDKKVELCLAFRHYLHYHIKCAKTNLHMRMRRKVRGWLQLINRAFLKSDVEREKKTITGRTFTRKA
mmetsp:Transcript_19509/g.61085  ORF Transcript_19509/g.61085 Transcript_19509/m.61085 type:complete len:319 (+) Transcript_19509:656-1612(+)